MKTLALHVKSGRGAAEFQREANAFARHVGRCEVHPFDADDAEQVEGIIAMESEIECIAIFCHGWRTRLQTGHAIRRRVGMRRLAGAIVAACIPSVRVALYACSTAGAPSRPGELDDLGGDGGFADVLRDELGAYGANGGWVDAHALAGHTTRQPHVRRFYTDGDPSPSQGIGGDWIVPPRSSMWSRWREALRGPMRFDLPRLDAEEIRKRVADHG